MRVVPWFGLVGWVSACTSSPSGDGGPARCGVASGSTFHIDVQEAFIFPYKPDTQDLWDWDGNVPNWLLKLTDELADISASPDLETAAEILHIVDEVAPQALKGTTPPDPILYVAAALDEATTTTTSTVFGGSTYTSTYESYTFGTLDASDDTYEPSFHRGVDVDLYPDETLWLDVVDEDLAEDDPVGSVELGLHDLARCGPTTFRGGPDSGLYSVTLTVDPQ